MVLTIRFCCPFSQSKTMIWSSSEDVMRLSPSEEKWIELTLDGSFSLNVLATQIRRSKSSFSFISTPSRSFGPPNIKVVKFQTLVPVCLITGH